MLPCCCIDVNDMLIKANTSASFATDLPLLDNKLVFSVEGIRSLKNVFYYDVD